MPKKRAVFCLFVANLSQYAEGVSFYLKLVFRHAHVTSLSTLNLLFFINFRRSRRVLKSCGDAGHKFLLNMALVQRIAVPTFSKCTMAEYQQREHHSGLIDNFAPSISETLRGYTRH